MQISLTDFIGQLAGSPALVITTLLTFAVILVNGWTDAPNAIANLCVDARHAPRSLHHHGRNF